MKIAIYSKVFSPSIGGMETYSRLIANEFVLNGDEVSVITDTLKKDTYSYKFNLVRTNSLINKFLLLKKQDVIIMINFSLRNFLLFLFFRKKIIINHQTNYYNSGKLLSIFTNSLKKFFSNFFINASCSKFVSKTFYNNSNVILNCYEEKIFKKKKKIKKKDFVFCGRLVHEKGVLILLYTFKKLVKIFPETTLSIVGDGPLKAEITKFINNNRLSKNIKVFGVVRDVKLNNLINEHKCMIVPSLWEEPFGIVALEGIASTNYVIASNKGGLPEAVGKCGLTIPLTKKKLLNAMIDFCNKKNFIIIKSEYYEKKCKEHLKRFTPRAVIQQYIKLFKKSNILF